MRFEKPPGREKAEGGMRAGLEEASLLGPTDRAADRRPAPSPPEPWMSSDLSEISHDDGGSQT